MRPSRKASGAASLLALASGCHVLAGLDDLTLREDARVTWRAPLASEGAESVTALSVTDAGLVLAAGLHDGPLALGETTLPGSGAGRAAFVASLTSDGTVARALELTSTESVRALTATQATIAGTFSGSLAVGNTTLNIPGSKEALFVLELEPTTGAFAGARALGGSGFAMPGGKLDAARDSGGNLVLGGSYVGRMELDGCAAYPTKAKPNLFLVKLSPEGKCLWSVKNEDEAPQAIESVAVDSLNDFVVVGGEFVGRLELGRQTALQNSGGVDLFVARFRGDGELEWARSFGNGLVQGSARVAAAPGGFSALAAYFEGVLELGAGSLKATRGHDVVVANFRPDGQLDWQRQLRLDRAACEESSCELDELDLAFDPEGNLVVAAPFVGAAAIEGVAYTRNPGDAATLLAKFDRSGNLLWSGYIADVGATCASIGHCRAVVALDSSRDVLLGGSFAGSLSFAGATSPNGGELARPLPAAGETDGFVAKFLR